MNQPYIDFVKINQAISIAKEMLQSYQENRKHLKVEISNLSQEIEAVETLINLTSREKKRRKILHACSFLSEEYADIIGNEGNKDQHQSFLHTLNYQKKSYKKLLDETEKAIAILKLDIKELQKVAHASLRPKYYYFAIPSHGWAFLKFSPIFASKPFPTRNQLAIARQESLPIIPKKY